MHADRPVHAVLPGERQVAGAHLRVRAAGRARAPAGGHRRGQPGHRRRPRRRGCRSPSTPTATRGRRAPSRPRRASSAPPCRWRSCPRCRSDDRARALVGDRHPPDSRRGHSRTGAGWARSSRSRRGGPRLRRRRPAGRRLPAAHRRRARRLGRLPAQGRADRRRPDRRVDRPVPAAPERVRAGHRMLDDRQRTSAAPRRGSRATTARSSLTCAWTHCEQDEL